MKAKFIISAAIHSVLVSLIANSFIGIWQSPQYLFLIVPIFLFICIFAGAFIVKPRRSSVCLHGTVLLYAFCTSLLCGVVYQSFLAARLLPEEHTVFIWNLVYCVGVNFVIFWIGILCVYLASAQLGAKLRIVGAICGLIPLVNLIALFFIIKSTTAECMLEIQKDQMNQRRSSDRICATQYPILMVHGVFFRDTKFFNYWGRIPKELERNGAQIFYGNHPSASSVADSAAMLKERVVEILVQTGAKKVNIIAHSKGGLDCRYAIANYGMGEYVASLTTVNTPHRGCLFADYLLTKIPEDIKNQVAETYNKALKRLGDKDPDFLAAVNDLTDAYCKELDAQMPTPEGIYCQSIGSVLTKSTGGKFPLNFSYHLVKHFSGENDGLVSEDSFQWGEKYTLLRAPENRGISHMDIIDLSRENISGFDVREFYVKLVNDLKNRGL